MFALANKIGATTTILHFDGVAWTEMTVPGAIAPIDVTTVWGTGPMDVFVAGGTILHFV